MINSFRDKKTRALFRDGTGHKKCQSFDKAARRKLVVLDAAMSLHDLERPPNNRLKLLKGHRQGQHSIRINDQYRVCFRWRDGDAYDAEITDYH